MNTDFLKALLSEAAPSGHEERAAAVWRAEAETFADRVWADDYGNVYAEIHPPDSPQPEVRPIALTAHLDEIGLMVTHIDEGGLIAFAGIGWWDPQVLVGQRVRLLAAEGDLIGVIGKLAVHLMEPAEATRAVRMPDLWIDVPLDEAELRRRVPTGTVGVLEQAPLEVGGHLIARALDNRAGAFIVLEALRRLKAAGVARRVVAVATVEEELGFFGAQVSGHALNPAAAVIVDGLHETGQPGVGDRRYGRVRFGSGANLAVGARLSRRLLDQLVRVAREQDIAHSLSARPEATGTDNDQLALARAGIPTAQLSLPMRYVHSPSEMVCLSDVGACTDLIVAWAGRLGADLELKAGPDPVAARAGPT